MDNQDNKGFQSLRYLREKRQDGTFGEIIDDWKWIISYGRGYKAQMVVFTVMGIVSSTFGLVSSVANKYLIDIITQHQIEKLWIAVLITVGSLAFSLVFSSVSSRFSCKLAIAISMDVQSDVYGKLLDADWQAMGKFTNGDMLSRMNDDIGTVSSNAITWLPTIIVSVYHFVATFVVIWHYSKVMSVIALSSAPILLLLSRPLLARQRTLGKRMKAFRSRMVSYESETFYHMDTVKSLGLGETFNQRFHSLQLENKSIALENNLFKITTNIILTLVGTAVQTVAFGYSLFLLWTDRITYGTMVLFLQQRSNLSGAFKSVAGIIPNFVSSSVSAHRIRELVELPRERHGQPRAASQVPEGGLSVHMKDVRFAYDSGEPVIEHGDFVAEPGEIVALVGVSGKGKTTLLRLMLGLVYPQSGVCCVRTSSGEDWDLSADSRTLFTYVPQGNTLMAGTIAENMRLVRPEATDEEIIRALQDACAWDFVSNLPDGIHTRLGEKGKGLSEGQAQRVAIARAMLRDAPILLLDEATSALDEKTEQKVLENILRQDPNHTCIITTHRPSVMQMCSRVYTVSDTQRVEQTEAH